MAVTGNHWRVRNICVRNICVAWDVEPAHSQSITSTETNTEKNLERSYTYTKWILKYNTSTKSQQMHKMNCKYNGLNTVAYYLRSSVLYCLLRAIITECVDCRMYFRLCHTLLTHGRRNNGMSVSLEMPGCLILHHRMMA